MYGTEILDFDFYVRDRECTLLGSLILSRHGCLVFSDFQWWPNIVHFMISKIVAVLQICLG